MKALKFRKGKVTIHFATGGKEVEAWFFDWFGVELAITPREGVVLGWRVTHPPTGCALPRVHGLTREQAYNSFLTEAPIMEEKIRSGLSLIEHFKWAAENVETVIKRAREDALKGN